MLKRFTSPLDIDQEVFESLASKYEVPVSFVADCWDSAENWLEAEGKKKKNYKSFLANWVKRAKMEYLMKVKKYQSFEKKGGIVDVSKLK
jgi:hypothetical protein